MTMQTPMQSGGSRPTDPPGANPSRPGEPGAVDAAKDEAQMMVDRAKGETSRLVDEARKTVRSQSEQQTGRLASGAHDLARQLDALASGRGETEGAVAEFAHQAATRIDGFARRLDNEGVDGMTREVKQFARRRPGTYLLGAFAVGVTAGRLFRNADSAALAQAARPGSSDPQIPQTPTQAPTQTQLTQTHIQEDLSWTSHPQH